MGELLERLEDDPTLESVEGEVALMTARVMRWLSEHQDSWSLEVLGQFSIIAERLMLAKQRQQRIAIERGKLLTAEAVREWLLGVRAILETELGPDGAAALYARLATVPLAAGTGSRPPEGRLVQEWQANRQRRPGAPPVAGEE